MTASNRLNPNTELDKIDETHDKFTVGTGELAVNERNFDRQPHTHHKLLLDFS